ncbi:hypothetical protein [Cryptosporangium aurantiacum]|uniref:Uncharacterized protein n=1 Tax=Cryptosporangium aurantiacum TaxID=134849 RepID=A0A1M7R2X3_9ACTN|nr:hypothetical protein [Cryptosporangium aurantiacum]SHN39303.1 hypothetical protein SAMN05443668_106246 [Cryptosporangium aurantiacum]
MFPPSQAQGANQAIEDAWLLTRALRHAAVEPALRGYEARRARRVRLVARLAASESTNRVPPSPLAALSRSLRPSLAGRLYTHLLYRYSSVLHDEQP